MNQPPNSQGQSPYQSSPSGPYPQQPPYPQHPHQSGPYPQQYPHPQPGYAPYPQPFHPPPPRKKDSTAAVLIGGLLGFMVIDGILVGVGWAGPILLGVLLVGFAVLAIAKPKLRESLHVKPWMIVFFGFLGLMGFATSGLAYKVKVQKEEREAMEAQRREEATAKVAEAIDSAKQLYGDGKLEEAVKALEAVVDDGAVIQQADNAAEAHELLQKYGAEYGVQFEPQVAALIAKADAALRNRDADAAEKILKEAMDFRYAPNCEAASKLHDLVKEARSEWKMKTFVEGMSEAEFQNFIANHTLPSREVFEREDLDAIFKATLKLNRDKAKEWREAAKKAEPELKALGFTIDEFRSRSDSLVKMEPSRTTTPDGTVHHTWEWNKQRWLKVIGPDDRPTSVIALAGYGFDNEAELLLALIHISSVVNWVTGESVDADTILQWAKQGDRKFGKFTAGLTLIKADDGLVMILGIQVK